MILKLISMTSDPSSQRRIEELFYLLKEAALERLRFLPGVSSLAATLLVIATFNNQLLRLTDFVKVLISLLLLLIPFSIFFYLYEINETLNEAQKNLEKELGKKLISKDKKILLLVGVYFPWIALIVMSFVILSILILIWK